MRVTVSSLSLSWFLSLGVAAAPAQHSDVSPGTAGGRLVTGGIDHHTLEFIPDVRVFGYEFGEHPLQPYFTEDPGFDALPASSGGTFPSHSSLGFDIQADLKYWTGSGYGAVPSGESLRIEKGSFAVNVGSGELLPKTGLHIGTSGADGGLHEHLDVFLFGSDGNADPGDGIEPAAGIYLLEITLRTDAPGIEPSESLWIVYNNGLDEEDHDAAMAWVHQHLVPEPTGAMTLCGMASGLFLVRRRRS